MPMDINSAKFIKGIVGTDPVLADGKLQVAFVGRSNVGKSSMINSLVGSKSLVKSSSTPGRTKEINLFLINERFYFVDLPGYGYAKISAKQAEKMRKMIMWYLEQSKTDIGKAVLIIDAKAGPKKFDIEMKELLESSGHEFVIVANKSDKINQKEKAMLEKKLEEIFPSHEAVFYSSKTGKGREKLLERVLL